MKKLTKILWGIVLIVLGVVFALNALNIANIDVFFDGWWTLFIIIPSVVGLVTDDDKTGSLIGIAIGVFLLLCCQDILSFSMLWKLGVPVIIVLIGLKMVCGGIFGNKANKMISEMKANGKEFKTGCATFSGCNMNFDNEFLTAQNFQLPSAALNATYAMLLFQRIVQFKCRQSSAVLKFMCRKM